METAKCIVLPLLFKCKSTHRRLKRFGTRWFPVSSCHQLQKRTSRKAELSNFFRVPLTVIKQTIVNLTWRSYTTLFLVETADFEPQNSIELLVIRTPSFDNVQSIKHPVYWVSILFSLFQQTQSRWCTFTIVIVPEKLFSITVLAVPRNRPERSYSCAEHTVISRFNCKQYKS